MREVVTNFLNFAKPAQLVMSPVDLGAVADRAADDLRGDARALSGDIVVEGQFATVEGDDVLLRQAFSNLLRNAIEACAAVGIAPAIIMEAQIDRSQRVCTVSVRDNGPGFPEHVRERVFHPFFTTKAQGTGLGLALVQKIVVTHNGRVTAGGGPDGGGLITVVLPIAEQT
jgi:two-component system sensor histidine kinase HydH